MKERTRPAYNSRRKLSGGRDRRTTRGASCPEDATGVQLVGSSVNLDVFQKNLKRFQKNLKNHVLFRGFHSCKSLINRNKPEDVRMEATVHYRRSPARREQVFLSTPSLKS